MAGTLTKVADILDGVWGFEEAVSLFRGAATNLDSCDRLVVARLTALRWTRDAADLLDVAEEIRDVI